MRQPSLPFECARNVDEARQDVHGRLDPQTIASRGQSREWDVKHASAADDCVGEDRKRARAGNTPNGIAPTRIDERIINSAIQPV